MGSINPRYQDNPAAAFGSFLDIMQQAAACITPSVLRGQAFYPSPEPHVMSFGGSRLARLGRRSGLSLKVIHRYRLTANADDRGSWRVSTDGYVCEVLDRQAREIVSSHWHPAGRSPITVPHLHVGGHAGSVDLSKAHLPTGRVSLVVVIRMTITEFGVEPLRDDWRAVLDRAETVLGG